MLKMKLFSRIIKLLRKPFFLLNIITKGFQISGRTSIHNLSDELLSNILSELSITERIKLQLVSKQWKKVIEKSFAEQSVLIISEEKYFPIKQCCIQSRISGKEGNNYLIVSQLELCVAQKIMKKFNNLETICWVTKRLNSTFEMILKSILSNENHINLKSVSLFDISNSCKESESTQE